MGTLKNASKVMKRMARTVSKQESRPILQCVQLKDGVAASTDSYRLTVERGCWDGPEILIPSGLAREIAKAKAGDAEVELHGSQIDVTLPDGTKLVDKQAEGKYPNYAELLKVNCMTLVYVNRDELLAKVREVIKLKNKTLAVEVAKDGFAVNGTLFEKASAEGDELRIGFNPAYMRDALLSIESEVVRIAFDGPLKPAIISGETDFDVQVLLMPVRLDAGKKKGAKGMRKAPKSPEPKSGKVESLKGERVCITGTLSTMTRSEAFTRLKLAGGIPSERFSSKVTMLVVAENSGNEKRKKAETAIAKGQKVKVVSGTEFEKALTAAGERKQEEHMAKKESKQDKPITVECFGRSFYASNEKGQVITPGGPNSGVSFEVGKAYRYREGGREYAAASLGYDVYKGEKKCLFAVFENGEWKGYLRTVAWAKLKAMANNPIDEPKKLTPPPVKDEQKKETPKVKAPRATEKKEDAEMKDRIEELEKMLAETRKELESVWKENEGLKRKVPKAEPEKPAKSGEEAAAEVSLATMQKWCEGKGLIASQKREGACIWVEGDSKPYAEELKEMGFRFAKKRKSWYFAA